MKKIAKILSIVLCLAMVLSFASVAFAAESTATISFADTANRTVMNDDQQVWEQNGITVTNDRAESTQPVKDYSNPVRFYAKTTVTIEYPGMTAIVFDCNSDKHATNLVDSVSGAEAVAAADVVTITLPTAADSFTVALVAQVRVDEITVYAGTAPVAPVVVNNVNVNEKLDSANWTLNGENIVFENGCMEFNTGDAGVSGAAMLNQSEQNVSYKFNLAINGLAPVSMDDWTWWDSELLIVARSTIADASWCDGSQTGYTLTAWGDMSEVFIGRAGYDDAFGSVAWNVNDGESHEIEFSVANNADNTAVTLTLIVDGEKLAEIVDDGSLVKGDRPALYPDAGNLTIRAKYLDITVGVEAPSEPAADSTLTIAEAIALGASKEHNTYTAGKYYVSGVITEVYNTQYGNMKITDEAGNILTIYGTYSADGSTRYDALDVKPVAGDTVTIYGIIGQYNGNPQIKNGWITAHTPNENTQPDPEVPADPEADSVLTIEEAIALGASKNHNTYTEGKYYVTGVITEVYNEQYGNMKITDEAGNILTIYGTYSADGSTRYDALEVKPVAGDTVTIYGIIGQYNGTPQIKNGWITAHTPAVCEHANTEVKDAKAASCTEAGYTGDTYCADCGELIAAGEEIAVLEHTYVDGACSVCGAADPNAPVGESKTITINGATFTAEAGKWLYNTYVNEKVAGEATNAYMYSMIIFDKNYTGEAFNTNGYGAAIVLDKEGKLIKIYDGANVAFWTAEGKTAAHFTSATFATTAWTELQEGETLIIFPNDGASNAARKWALDLRGLNGTTYIGEVATLEGFTFEETPVEPTEPQPTEPVGPSDPSDTGDLFGIVVAVMAISGIALVTLKKKEN